MTSLIEICFRLTESNCAAISKIVFTVKCYQNTYAILACFSLQKYGIYIHICVPSNINRTFCVSLSILFYLYVNIETNI